MAASMQYIERPGTKPQHTTLVYAFHEQMRRGKGMKCAHSMHSSATAQQGIHTRSAMQSPPVGRSCGEYSFPIFFLSSESLPPSQRCRASQVYVSALVMPRNPQLFITLSMKLLWTSFAGSVPGLPNVTPNKGESPNTQRRARY